MSGEKWESAKRILCIRLDSLGDVMMTAPAMRALKESLSGREITLLTSPSGAAVAKLLPEVTEVIHYEAPWMKATKKRKNSQPDLEMIAHLKNKKFEAAVIFTVFSQNPLPSAALAYLADIPLRLAYCRENPYQLLTHWVKEPEPETGIRHEVRRQLDLVANIGAFTRDERLSIRVPSGSRRKVTAFLEHLGIYQSDAWVLLHPGSTAPSRRYMPEGFSQVADMLFLEHGILSMFTGTEGEVPLVREIQAAMRVPSYSVAGRLDLGCFAALVQMAPLLISNNTGPVHIAAAVGTPVVDLYALTNPQHIPWQVPNRVLNQDVPCKFCYRSICPEKHHNCLRLVSPRQVVDAALDLLQERHPANILQEI